MARDLGRALSTSEGSTPERLTVFLGSGASRSSGGPGTGEVEELLDAMFERFGGRIGENMHRVDHDDRSRALSHRFEGLVPYIGYRCLASLGRTHRVLVINANWDPLLVRACELLGVSYVSFDLREQAKWPDLASLGETGIIDVHFHGDLDAPRHGAPLIGWQTPDQVALLRTLHAGARRLYVGLSLDVDHDLVALGADLDDEHRHGWAYAFFKDDPAALVTVRQASLHANDPVFVQREDVDFDRVMLIVADTLAPPELQWTQHESHLQAPDLSLLVIPRADVLGTALDHHVAVLVGEAQIGKSTAARLIGYLHQLFSVDGGRVRYVDELNAPAALGSASNVRIEDLLVLDSPFGEGGDQPATVSVRAQIEEWIAEGSASRLVIASRVGPFVAANLSFAEDLVSGPSPSDWYDIDALRIYARARDAEVNLVTKVEPGWLDTPARIEEARAGLTLRRQDDADARESEALTERVHLLEGDRALALSGTVVRLSEFGSGSPTLEHLRDVVSGVAFHSSAARLMLVPYVWDGRARVRLRHALDREAIDCWIDAHRDEIDAALADAPEGLGIDAGLRAWCTCADARAGRFDQIAEAAPAVIGEHLGAMLRVAPRAEVLALAEVADFDEWSAHDFAYSLLRTWEDLPSGARRKALQHLIGHSAALGTYGLLEACLYLGAATPDEALDAVHDALWQMVGDPARAFEAALCLDGFAWRVPPTTDWVRHWIKTALAEAPVLVGALPVLGAYHAGGVEAVGLTAELDEYLSRQLDPEAQALALRLVRWHFVHQSRARAMMAGQPWLDKGYLCRSFVPPAGDIDARHVRWLLEVLADQGEPGWAFFAACFLMGGLDNHLDEPTRQRVAELLACATPADPGVLAAAATYSVATEETYRHQIWRYFDDFESRAALLDTLTRGMRVEGFDLVTPRFVFWGEIPERLRDLAIRFPRLGGLQPTDLESATYEVRHAADGALERGIGSRKSVKALLLLVEAGDFRILDAAAFDGASDLDGRVERALLDLEAERVAGDHVSRGERGRWFWRGRGRATRSFMRGLRHGARS